MRVGYISDWKEEEDIVYNNICYLSKKYNYIVYNIWTYESNDSVFNKIINLIKESDIIVANIFKGSLNIAYEIGLAHGLKKPVIIFSENTYNIPEILKNEKFIYNSYINNKESSFYAIDNAIKTYLNRKNVDTYFKQDNSPLNIEQYSDEIIDGVSNIIEYKGFVKHRYLEKWFINVVKNIKEWEIFESTGNEKDTYDFVIWNNINKNNFYKLGNPIAIEIKGSKILNKKQISDIVERAIKNELHTIIIITLAEISNIERQYIYNENRINIIFFDKYDLESIKSSRKFLEILNKKLINNLVY